MLNINLAHTNQQWHNKAIILDISASIIINVIALFI